MKAGKKLFKTPRTSQGALNEQLVLGGDQESKINGKVLDIYVFGTPLVEQDSLTLRMLPKLRKQFKDIEFVELDPTENIPEEENLVIIDSIVGIDRVRVLTLDDLDKIELSPRCSLHDFDLGFSLKLMKKLGKVKEVSVLGVPASGGEGVFEELKEVISNLLLKNA